MPVTPTTVVTDVELGALVGVSARRVRQLAETGTLERVGRNGFELGPSLRALLEEAAGSGSALQRERTRKVAADASRAELELVRELGLVAPIAEFERAQEKMNAVLRQAILTVPARVAMNLVGEKSEIRIKQILGAELSDALRSVAEADLNLEETEDDEFEN